MMPFPLPFSDLPASPDWRIHEGAAWRRRQRERVEVAADLLATTELTVGSRPVENVTSVRAGLTYDVELVVTLEQPPRLGESLVVRSVSTLPPDSYIFIEAVIPTEPETREYTLTGTLRFDYAQAPGSRPLEVRLLTALERGEETRALTLIGRRSVVVSIEHEPTSASLSRITAGQPRPTLHIPGERMRGGGQRLIAAGQATRLAPQPFLRFLALVVAAYETQDGFMDGEEFIGSAKSTRSGWDSAELDRGAAAIRGPLEAALGFDTGALIEIRGRSIRFRRELVELSYDRDSLIRKEGDIGRLAQCLPDSGTATTP
jgi:hypothetical protein